MARSAWGGRLTASWCVLFAGVGFMAASTARAAGVEESVAGSVALGRAANFARVNDFMATWQNPANLALVPGKDAGVELRLPVYNACFNRARDPDIEYKPYESFNKVCNGSKVFPTGNAGFAMQLNRGFGVGVGAFTPSGISKVSFGHDNIRTSGPAFDNEQFPITTTGEESANRFLLFERKVIAGFLMVGAGWQIIPQLRVGLSLGAGFADISYKNAASLSGGTFLDQEVVNKVKVSDWFVPRLTAAVAATPIDSVDVFAQVTVNGDINAHGRVDVTANGIQGAPLGDCKATDPGVHCRVNDVKLDVPYQRVEVYAGARYASRRPGRVRGRTLDPIRDEFWDVELDLYYSNTGNVGTYELELYDLDDPADRARIDFTSDPAGSPSPLPATADIPHNWRDTFGLRVGGDYTILPSMLAVRAGFSYETSAARTPFLNIDYFPVQRFGLHIGASYVISMVTIHFAYAHLFYEKRTTPVGEGRVPEIVALERDEAQAVNEGSYTARADLISLQVNVDF